MEKKILLLVVAAMLGACGGDDDPTPGNDAGTDTSVPVDSSMPTCDDPDEVEISGTITSNTSWGCEHVYVLTGQVFVQNNAVLTIAAGTRIEGNNGSVLIITRGSRLEAVGTAADPIIFTSHQPEGFRFPQDWGGVVLLGDAEVNAGENVFFEAGDSNDQRYYYGPNNGGAANDNTGSCGNLQFVELHFAGFPIVGTADKEYNALTVAGCGSGTTLSNIHAHRGADDGIEFFGGVADLDHAVITLSEDDGLDWDFGWRGNAQFIIIQTSGTGMGDKAIEADNNEGGTLATPRSGPTVYNMTAVGPGASPARSGIQLRRATQGIIRNTIIQGFATAGIDIAPSNGSEADWGTTLLVENTFFFNAPIPTGDATFMDNAQITNAARNNQTAVDPGLATGTVTAPNYVPTNAALNGQATPPAGFDTAATYAGAVAPNATGAGIWYSWMTFPAN